MSNFEKKFDALMEEVEILRAHFDFVDRKAERLMVKYRRARNEKDFDKVVALRKASWREFEKAIDLIATQITTPKSLRRGRKEILEMKGIAWKFVQRLRNVEATIKDLEAALNAMQAFVKTLNRVL
jgi:hypothetical protein